MFLIWWESVEYTPSLLGELRPWLSTSAAALGFNTLLLWGVEYLMLLTIPGDSKLSRGCPLSTFQTSPTGTQTHRLLCRWSVAILCYHRHQWSAKPEWFESLAVNRKEFLPNIPNWKGFGSFSYCHFWHGQHEAVSLLMSESLLLLQFLPFLCPFVWDRIWLCRPEWPDTLGCLGWLLIRETLLPQPPKHWNYSCEAQRLSRPSYPSD